MDRDPGFVPHPFPFTKEQVPEALEVEGLSTKGKRMVKTNTVSGKICRKIVKNSLQLFDQYVYTSYIEYDINNIYCI